MRISKARLRRIIKEEKAKLLKEVHGGGWDGGYAGNTMDGHEAMAAVADELEERGIVLDKETWRCIAIGIQYMENLEE